MTNEQIKAKELAELLTAFAEGKQFEYKAYDNELWEDFLEPTIKRIYSTPIDRIRIKPETKRVPLTKDDLIDRELRKDTISMISGGNVYHIGKYNRDEIYFYDGYHRSYEFIKENCTFLDGTPCYKEVEDE